MSAAGFNAGTAGMASNRGGSVPVTLENMRERRLRTGFSDAIRAVKASNRDSEDEQGSTSASAFVRVEACFGEVAFEGDCKEDFPCAED